MQMGAVCILFCAREVFVAVMGDVVDGMPDARARMNVSVLSEGEIIGRVLGTW